MTALLERAIQIACAFHEGQTDKAGEPYILHPLRVMMAVDGADARIVAVLHDLIEDTACNLAFLHQSGFSPEILHAVDALTLRPNEDYLVYIDRAGANELARQVKIADLEDNLRGVPDPKPNDAARSSKYRQALDILRALK